MSSGEHLEGAASGVKDAPSRVALCTDLRLPRPRVGSTRRHQPWKLTLMLLPSRTLELRGKNSKVVNSQQYSAVPSLQSVCETQGFDINQFLVNSNSSPHWGPGTLPNVHTCHLFPHYLCVTEETKSSRPAACPRPPPGNFVAWCHSRAREG